MQLTRDLKINLKTSISTNGDTVTIIKEELIVCAAIVKYKQ